MNSELTWDIEQERVYENHSSNRHNLPSIPDDYSYLDVCPFVFSVP